MKNSLKILSSGDGRISTDRGRVTSSSGSSGSRSVHRNARSNLNLCSMQAANSTAGMADQPGSLRATGGDTASPAVCQIVGYKNSGKTTLICELIPLLRSKGCTVAVIKHDGHDFDMDHEGTDTWKQRQAGASAVAITSGTRTAKIEERASSLAELIAAFADYDYVLVEGFKQEQYPKIGLIRREADFSLLSEVSNLSAVALWSTAADAASLPQMPGISQFSINDSVGIAEFLWQQRFLFSKFQHMKNSQ
ncbi:molybdopterin-guanine dinucleotide biosynthesis protein B [Paenibacillus sp. BAC0078]